jgi:hypothetical protein
MIKIYSQKEPGKLLHLVVNTASDFSREQLIENNEFLQVASLDLKQGESFLAHRHLWKDLPSQRSIAQESWVVIKGKVEVSFYDIDGEFLQKKTLNTGHVSITLYGGHSYEILEDSLVFEFKSGPYLGRELDKELI